MKQDNRDSFTSFQSLLLSSIKLIEEIFDNMYQFNRNKGNIQYQLFLDDVLEVIYSFEDTKRNYYCHTFTLSVK